MLLWPTTVARMERPPAPHIPLQGEEVTLLNAFLDFYRAALLDRAFGLSHEQMQIALPPSSLTLSRLIGHMAWVEELWFQVRFADLEHIGPWADLDWDADNDAEMSLSQTWSTEQLLETFEASVAGSRARVSAASSLDQLSVNTTRKGEKWNLRWILIHMIEEYARHCGHADLIRESIDGNTAE